MTDDADPLATVQALGSTGAGQVDPARLRYLQTLAARAGRAEGALRSLLLRRLSEALQVQSMQPSRLVSKGPAAASARPSALSMLVRELDARGSATVGPTPGAPAATVPAVTAAAPPELKALQRARGTWARLRVQQQIHRALATVPPNPGPLNSHLLVLRALQRLQALSPAYLERFVVHAETLAWLEQALQPPHVAAAGPRGRPPARLPPRARGGSADDSSR